jgi:RNA polymerase sigma-70 factor (ECF subfamily)
MTLWVNFDKYTPGSNFLAWSRKIAFNKVRSFQQLRRHKTVLCGTEFLETVDRVIAARADTLDAQYAALSQCIEKLHPRDRDLIDRRYRVGATPKMLADQIGRSLTTIYKSLRRIHSGLFECVQRATAKEGSS